MENFIYFQYCLIYRPHIAPMIDIARKMWHGMEGENTEYQATIDLVSSTASSHRTIDSVPLYRSIHGVGQVLSAQGYRYIQHVLLEGYKGQHQACCIARGLKHGHRFSVHLKKKISQRGKKLHRTIICLLSLGFSASPRQIGRASSYCPSDLHPVRRGFFISTLT